ncbi:uncharacterized protein LOC131008385 [Salvia miltiorrhiza]|uniref:uncharacterized protein LOC131008385 n=1 Tax=Salvia miltiorrhiza TaxID=226208 RepID=UPI0025AD422E|nr:uncharacterized protein LOC131008385 [Salvia miltiorrhiza]
MPIKVDGATAHGEVGHYARVLVEVDLAHPLPESACVDCHDRSIYVEFGFEQLPAFCTRCKITGHALDKCKKRSEKVVNSGTESGNKQTDKEGNNGDEVITKKVADAAGQVQKNNTLDAIKPKPAWRPRENINQETAVGNRFNALAQVHIEEFPGADLLEQVTRDAGDGLNKGKECELADAEDSDGDTIEHLQVETSESPRLNVAEERNQVERLRRDEQKQATLADNSLSKDEGGKVAALKSMERDMQINRDLADAKATEQVPLVKKRGRPPGQTNKEIRKQPPRADNIKGRLRKAQEVEPNPEAVESIKEQLYKAWIPIF